MQEQHEEDDGFEQELIEVTDLAQFNPISVKRGKRKQSKEDKNPLDKLVTPPVSPMIKPAGNESMAALGAAEEEAKEDQTATYQLPNDEIPFPDSANSARSVANKRESDQLLNV